MMPNPNVGGKRRTTMTGSGGSSPPPPHKRFRGARWYATHLLQFFPSHSLPRFFDPCSYVLG
jgi:hypothetical protein